MRVLILHQFVKHNSLVHTLCEKLNETEVQADSFNIATWEYKSISHRAPLVIEVLKFFLFHYKLKLLLVEKAPFILKSIFKAYDVVDIHFFGNFYYNSIDLIKKIEIKLKITLWGSDFYRASNIVREKQRPYYEKVDCIQIGTKDMKDDFLFYFKNFEDKIQIAHFGITQFDLINRIDTDEDNESIKNHLGLPIDKKIITCGYNGSDGQQHLLILDALARLDVSVRNESFLLFPMTYGVTDAILGRVKDKLKALNIDYLILTEDLTSQDVCRVRLATDIAINIQITDAFSASIQEHLYAKNVVIVGEWLPYSKLEENDVYYFKTSLTNLSDTIQEAITNFSRHKEKSSGNRDRMHQISSWDIVIGNWVSLYSTLV